MPAIQTSPDDIELLMYASSGTLIFVIIVVLVLVAVFQHRLRKQQQRQFTTVLNAIEEERKRIGRDLHDDVSPLISSALLRTDDSQLQQVLRDAAKEVREAAHRLMPGALEKQGLLAALDDLSRQLSVENKLLVELKSKGNFGELQSKAAIHLYRIVAELLNNAIRHGKASHIQLTLLSTTQSLHIEVEDNGSGFDAALVKQGKGIGWQNISSRIKFLEGTYTVDTSPGKGCRVKMEFKLTFIS